MPTIATITFNPCIDKSTTVPAIIPEAKLYCTPPKFEPGGGGINVARAIKKLGGEALAIYPSGGYSGKFLNVLLEKEGIKTLVVETLNHTRENMIALDVSSNKQYRFGMPGSPLSNEEWQRCLKLVEQLKDVTFIVASGSLPPGVPADIFAQIARIAKSKGAKLIVDTSGDALKYALEEGVYLVKPNLKELASLTEREEVSISEVSDNTNKLITEGKTEAVVVSLGGSGAMLATKYEYFQITPPVVDIKSTVGAGDSMVAGIVLSLSKGIPLTKAVQYGVACGTAATLNPGTELCKLEDVQQMAAKIKCNLLFSVVNL